MNPLWILKRILWEQPTELYPESYKLRKVIFLSHKLISKFAWTDSGKGPIFCPFVKFLIFPMRNLVHGNSIAAKENSRNNFYLLSLPSPWEEAMIRNSHSLGVGKKTKSGYDLRNTRKRGSWQDWSQPIFPFSPHGTPLLHPCFTFTLQIGCPNI